MIIRSRIGRAMRTAIGHALLHVALVLAGMTFMLPLFWVVSTSLKAPNVVFTVPMEWIPKELVWSNYVRMVTIDSWNGIPAIVVFFKNTMILATLATLGTLISSTLVAYSLSRLEWRGRNLVLTLTLAVMMLPGVVTMVPNFLIFRNLGWLDSF